MVKIIRLINNEKGSVLIFAILLPVLLLFCGLLIDLGRIHIAKNKLQAAVDAGSLAAVTTADIEPIIQETEVETEGEDGEIITEIIAEIIGWQVVFRDPLRARTAARDHINLNASPAYWAERGVKYQEYMDGHVEGNDSYYVEAEAQVKTIFYGPMKALITGDNNWQSVWVKVKSTSQLVVIPEEMG